MATCRPIRFPTPQETNAAMRAASGDIMETIANTREVLRQSREAVAKANRLLDGKPDRAEKPSGSPADENPLSQANGVR